MSLGREVLVKGVVELLRHLRAGDFTSYELNASYLEEVERHHSLNSYITVTGERLLEGARESDKRRKRGDRLGRLEGIGIGIKDIFCTKGVKTTVASKILGNFVPSYESTVTSKLWEEGALMIGKTNMDEFAMGSDTRTSAYGATKNSWKKLGGGVEGNNLVPGGSSGGSAAAVSSGISPVALGTDTGGSIRQPASFTGTVGFKPTYGRCSRLGIIAFASSLDQAGVLARNVEDASLVGEVISGYDAGDSTSMDIDVDNYSAYLGEGIEGLRVGIVSECEESTMLPAVKELWHKTTKLLSELGGVEVIDISMPTISYGLPTYYMIASSECSSNLARYDGVRYGSRVRGSNLAETLSKTRSQGFGDEVKRRILFGTYALSAGHYDAYYKKAQQVRRKIAQDFMNSWDACDFIMIPTTPYVAYSIQEKESLEVYKSDEYTVPASLAGLPAISVPVGFDSAGLPIGMQIIVPWYKESLLFRIASALEEIVMFDASRGFVVS